ncbi:MAG: hypothetical protein RJA07_1180 [Bacteroidota bacterium]
MKFSFSLLIFFLFTITISFGLALSEKQVAKSKAIEAVKLIELRQFDKGIKLLQEAAKFDPTNAKIVYQMGLAYYEKKDFENAILVFARLVKMNDLKPEYYRTYSNVYDDWGKQKEALLVLENGLLKFPSSSVLHLEMGNIFAAQKKYNAAITAYEKGIDTDPMLASNYYHAAKLYCYSNEEVWGMIYGELFMNLERNSKRTTEISKLLYETYLSEIKFTTDSTMTVSFSRNANSKNSEPFGVNIYEPTLIAALKGTKAININTLDKTRAKFLDIYYEKSFQNKFNNVLFQFQKQIKDAGHFEAYNHWLLYKGNETDFVIWQVKNKDKWERFIEWYKNHPINITDENKFVRTKY